MDEETKFIEQTTQKILALLQNKSYDTIEAVVNRVINWVKGEPIQITLLQNHDQHEQN